MGGEIYDKYIGLLTDKMLLLQKSTPYIWTMHP